MPKDHARKGAGFTFVELTFAMVVLVIGAAVLINHLAINYHTTKTERDRVFAYAKAQQILSELQGLVDRGGVEAGVDLDEYDDGVTAKNALTIALDSNNNLVLPDHVLSGNYMRDGEWRWGRIISVQPFAGISNRNVRYVTVTIYRRDAEGNEHAMADLSAVINSASSAFPTTQVFDVYLFAVENIPGWWVYMDTIQPFVESMITDLESRNPGLVFRTHWITKSSFGRNQGYRPYFNGDVDSYVASPGVYHYPGKMPAGSASVYYYVPDNVKAHVLLDSDDTNGYDAAANPHPYALADFFNHGMRYPDELALWQQRVDAIELREAEIAAATAGGTVPPAPLDDMSKEPTLRLFLEDLNTSPEKYRNALVINLHGELLPMPAIRNYSDAARAPTATNLANIRVVTHPEELRTRRDATTPASSDPVALRIYAYNDNHQTYAGVDRMPTTNYLTVEVVGMDLTDPARPGYLKPSCPLTNVPGGVSVSGNSDYATSWQTATNYYDSSNLTEEMWYFAYFVAPTGEEPFTRILLANTPVICPLDGNGRGLAATDRAHLYRMPYVPCPVEAARDFSTDLTTVNFITPKNTARWRLQVAPVHLTDNSFVMPTGTRYNPSDDVTLKVRTRIWTGTSPDTSGTMWPAAARNQPDNLSVTYTWWADSKDDVPMTERSQFNGDPRHLPYKDCFTGAADFPDAYNWYFDDFWDGVNYGGYDWPSIDIYRVRDRWNNKFASDVPRYMELFRNGLTESSAVYTTLTGYSYYYLGIGNEIGYDSANGYPSSIPLNLTPHGSAGNGYLNTITGTRRLVRKPGSGYWWGMPWLGELFPDEAAAAWYTEDSSGNMQGNLTPGTSTGQFYQSSVGSVYGGSNRKQFGHQLGDHRQICSTRGCTAFFNIGSSGSTFDHIFAGGDGTMAAPGLEIASAYNLTMTTTAPISRPFSLTDNASPGEEWNYAPYTNRFSASLYKTYFNHGSGTGSGLVKLVQPGNTRAGYVVVNGIDKTVSSGTSFIAKWAVLTLTHSFFEAGDVANTLRIQQLPRLEIEYPNDISELMGVTAIDIQFDIDWTRWDGLPYTQSGTFNEDESLLEYVIMYSRDNGTTWLYVQDNTLATPGYHPENAAYLVPDLSIGAETFNWLTPAPTFPEGSYLLRIDCFRQGAQVHYAFHRTKIYIQR